MDAQRLLDKIVELQVALDAKSFVPTREMWQSLGLPPQVPALVKCTKDTVRAAHGQITDALAYAKGASDE